MSWTHLEDKTVTARKEHRCLLCNEPIPKGSQYVRRTGIESGEGHATLHMHPECEEVTDYWDDQDWECLSGDFERPKADTEN